MAVTTGWRYSLVAALLAWSSLGAQDSVATTDARPVLAVMSFTGGSLRKGPDYAMLGQGIAEMLVVTLGANPKVRIVERSRLDALLEEQRLGASGQVDPETAARIGRVIGAKHFIAGGFFIDMKNRMRFDVSSVNVETTEIEYRETIEGDVKNLFALIHRIGRKLNDGLRLPPNDGDAELPKGTGDEVDALLHLGRATAAARKGDTLTAVAAVREVLKAYPRFARAVELEAALTVKKVP